MRTRSAKPADSENADVSSSTQMHVDLPSASDASQLAELLPDVDFVKPTPDSIILVYQFVLSQAREITTLTVQLEAVQADSLRKDVELDQTLQEHDVRLKELEASLESKVDEISKLKMENQAASITQNKLEAERAALSKSQSFSSTEVESLRLQVSDHEREKRDLINVIDRLRTDGDQREEEVKTLRSNLKDLRHEFHNVQSQLSETRAADTTAMFKIQHLEQQLELAQSAADTANAELAQKGEEFLKYRKEKHSELASITSQLDSLSATHSSTQATLDVLQRSYNEQSRQLTQYSQKVIDTEARLADQTASYKSEISSQTRLIALLESRNDQARIRVDEVEKEWEQMVKTAEERETSLTAEIERQRSRGDRLESLLEEFKLGQSAAGGGHPSGVQENTTVTSSDHETTTFSLSPAAGVAARLQRSGKSFTEVYAEYVQLKEELNHSRSEERKIKELLSQVLADIEERAPVLTQQRQEFERTKQEADQLANQLAQTLADRDGLKLHSADLEKQLLAEKNLVAELEQNASDLGRQIQHLTRINAIYQNPKLESVPVLPANIEDPLTADQLVSTDEVILFQNLSTLQMQNQKLLRIAHSTAQALDRKEREFRDAIDKEETDAIREANEAIAVLEEQLESQKKSHQLKLDAYAKELDLRRSYQGRGHPSEVPIPAATSNGSSDAHPGNADVQMQFDAYRSESDIDLAKLRDEAAAAQIRANQIAAELAKAKGTIEFLNERHRMQAEAHQVKERELQNVKQRAQDLRDQCTKFELAFNQATETLSQTQFALERLRTESANLRAERGIWKDVEARLTNENRVLTKERAHLTDLVGNVQKLHEDLDKANELDRRRQESQVQGLETQLQDMRNQLAIERDSSRSSILQKDSELRELRDRFDKSVMEQTAAVQALSLTETKQKALQERLEEMIKRAEAQQEKISVYERRHVSHTSQAATMTQSDGFNAENELAQLKADIKTAEIERVQAQEHAQQWRSISESNELAFQQLSNTFDELKASTQAQITAKEEELHKVLERLGQSLNELRVNGEKVTELQNVIESERIAFKRDQQLMETKLVEMTTAVANFESDNSSRGNEVAAQEQRARAAEKKYEDAIKAHADAITVADDFRQQLNIAQASARELQLRCDTAESRLTMSESSWNNQKELMGKELADLSKRCQDLTEQNEVLHHQLESVGAQASRIRQIASVDVSSESTSSGDEVDRQMADLRSVISFLRKEKEILDLQLDMAKQESARGKAEITHLSRLLNETRVLLSEEREKATHSASSAAEHAELIERLNQLNILRESNATLRAEANSNRTRVEQLETSNSTLNSELEPLRQRVKILEAEVEAKNTQIGQLMAEVKHWQERNAQILSKYDRVDPAELQQFKDQLDQANAKLAEVENENRQKMAESNDQTEKIRKNLQAHREALQKRNAQLKALKEESDQEKQRSTSEMESLRAQRDSLQARVDGEIATELTSLRDQIQTATVECSSLRKALEEAKSKETASGTGMQDADILSRSLSEITVERDSLLEARKTLEAQLAAVSSATAQLDSMSDQEKIELLKAKQEAEIQASEFKEKCAAMEEQNKTFRTRAQKMFQDLQIAKERVVTLEKEQEAKLKASSEALTHAVSEARTKAWEEFKHTSNTESQSESITALESKLKAQHASEMEALKSSMASNQPNNSDHADSERTRLAQELATARAELERLRETNTSLQKERDDAKAQGVEQGRKEGLTKVKLKDQQISKLSKRLQELEQAIAASNPVAPSQNASQHPQGSTAPAGVSIDPPATSNASQPGNLVARGRGVAPRGVVTRGRGGGRGSAPTASVVPSVTATPGAAAGTSILGAAGKRVRDGEPEIATESLAKRLKAGGPVTLNRSRALPPDDNP